MQQPDPHILISNLKQPQLYLFGIQQLTSALTLHKSFLYPHLKTLINCIQPLLSNQKDSISTKATQLLTLIISSFQDSNTQQLLKNHLMNQIVINLGHSSDASLRKVSHIFLLRYVEIYKKLDGLMFHYLDGGLKQNSEWQIQQKTINSFQSIFLLELKLVNWKSEYLAKMVVTLIEKIKHYNQSISKASCQALATIFKQKQIRQLMDVLSQETLEKIRKLIEQKTIAIGEAHVLEQLTEALKTLQPQKQQQHRLNPQDSQNKQNQMDQNQIDQNLIDQDQNSTITKQELVSVPLSALLKAIFSPLNPTSIRIDAYQILEQRYLGHQTNQIIPQLLQNHSKILKLLQEESLKFTTISLKFIQTYYPSLQSNSSQLLTLIHSLLQKLSNTKPSIRLLITQFIYKLLPKQQSFKKQWMQLMLEQLRNSNQHQKQEITGLLIQIFQDKNNLPQIDIENTLIELSKYVEEPKTRIKLRTFQCLILICLNYDKLSQGSKILEKELSSIYYQIFIQRVNKTKNSSNNNQYSLNKLKQLKPLIVNKSKYEILSQRDNSNSISSTMPLRNTFDTKSIKIPLKQSVERKSIDLSKNKLNLDYRSTKKVEQILSRKNTRSQYNKIQLPKLSKLKSFEPEIKSSRGYDFNFRASKSKLNLSRQSDFRSQSYLTRQQLQPLPQCQNVYKSIVHNLQDADWNIQVQAINNLRRINQHHSELITNSSVSNTNLLIQSLVKTIQSQRSTLSKNGLLCLTQMIEKLNHLLDPCIELIIDKLTKKSADANLFMNFEVKKCLNTLAQNLTEYKIISNIQSLKHSKSIPIKDSLIEMLHAVVRKQSNIKDVDKLSQLLSYFLDEGFYDLRTKAKDALRDLCDKRPGYQQKLKSKLSTQSYQRLISTKNQRSISVGPSSMNTTTDLKDYNMSNLSSTNLRSKWSKQSRYSRHSADKTLTQLTPTDKQEQKQVLTPIQPRKIKRKVIKVSHFPPQFLELDNLLASCKDSDWRKRIQSLKKVSNFALSFPQIFPSHRLNTQFIDIVAQQINQHNNKVSLNALQILKYLIISIQPLIENNISLITNCIFNLIGSNKSQHRALSQQIFQLLATSIDLNLLLQHWCFGCLFSIPKSREYLILKLMHSLKKISQTKNQLVIKHIMPMLDKLVEDKKPEIVYFTKLFAKELHKHYGEDMFQFVTKKVEILKYLKQV